METIDSPLIGITDLNVSRLEVEKALAQIASTHETSLKILANTSHLAKLDTLTLAVGQIATHAGEIKNGLLTAATKGRDVFIYRIVGGVLIVLITVILGLLFSLGTLLIGEKFGIIRDLWKFSQ